MRAACVRPHREYSKGSIWPEGNAQREPDADSRSVAVTGKRRQAGIVHGVTIVELVWPGTWLAHPDHLQASDLKEWIRTGRRVGGR